MITRLDASIVETGGISGIHIRELAVKVFMKIRKLDRAQALLTTAKRLGDCSFNLDLCEASIDGMEARYGEAREKLEALNRKHPMNATLLKRLVLICEQSRDYDSAAGYLRAALKTCRNDEKLQQKRKHYETLGVW